MDKLNAFELAEKVWPLLQEAKRGVPIEILQERLAKELGISEKILSKRPPTTSGTYLAAKYFESLRR